MQIHSISLPWLPTLPTPFCTLAARRPPSSTNLHFSSGNEVRIRPHYPADTCARSHAHAAGMQVRETQLKGGGTCQRTDPVGARPHRGGGRHSWAGHAQLPQWKCSRALPRERLALGRHGGALTLEPGVHAEVYYQLRAHGPLRGQRTCTDGPLQALYFTSDTDSQRPL